MTFTSLKPIKLLLTLHGALVIVIGLATAAAALLQQPAAIFVVAFEFSFIAAGVFTLALASGRIATGRAVTLLCIAGAIVAPTVCGYLAVNGELMERNLKWWALVRLALGVVPFVFAGLEVALRDPAASSRRLGLGVLLLLPTVAVAGAFSLPGVRAAFGELHGLVQVLATLGGFFVILGSVCAAGHYFISAFEHGVAAAERSEDQLAAAPTAGPGTP